MEQPQVWTPQSTSSYTIDDRGTLHIGPQGGSGGLPDSDDGSYDDEDEDEGDDAEDDDEMDVGGWDEEDFLDENQVFRELSADDRAVFLQSMQEYWECIRQAELRKQASGEGGDGDDDGSELDLDEGEDEGTYLNDDRPAKKTKLGSAEAGPSKPLVRRTGSGSGSSSRGSRKRRVRKAGGVIGNQVNSGEVDLGRVELAAME